MTAGKADRAYWVKTLVKIIDPVLTAGAKHSLKKEMPKGDMGKWEQADKDRYAYLEAVGRTLCGAAPWLAAPQKDGAEEALRQKYAALARATIEDITDPASPDYEPFFVSTEENGNNPFCQALVDAAFLAHAFLRAKAELFDGLSEKGKENLIACLKASRKTRPPQSNWLLFAGMVEAALYTVGEEPDLMRVDYCLMKHDEWYKGDGVYGDGSMFHWDYYNSFVIQPMFTDIARTFQTSFPEGDVGARRAATAVKRASRYAAILERLIAPDGTYPMIGRSITYRTGAFQLLAQGALQGFLPAGVSDAQVRCALTAVIHRCFDAPLTFDEKGWLSVGVCGHQPGLGENYICTGSLYLCTTGFLPLGLDEDHPFWNSDYAPYTSCKLWAGQDAPADHSI